MYEQSIYSVNTYFTNAHTESKSESRLYNDAIKYFLPALSCSNFTVLRTYAFENDGSVEKKGDRDKCVIYCSIG